METQKAVLLIVGVLVGGLLLGSVFSGNAFNAQTGDAVRRAPVINPGGDGGGSVQTMVIQNWDYITKDNYLFSGDSNCLDNNVNDMDCWLWSIGELHAAALGNIKVGETSNRGPTIQIRNDFNIDDDKDNPITVGGCYNLPNNLAKICMKNLSVSDTRYNTYEVNYDNSKDLSNGGTPSQTSEPVVEIAALEGLDNGLVVVAESFTDFGPGVISVSRIQTDKIWLHMNRTMPSIVTKYIDVFYEDVDNKVKWAGSFMPNTVSQTYKFGEVNYGNTFGNNIQLKLGKGYGAYGYGYDGYRLLFDVQKEVGIPVYADDLMLDIKNNSYGFVGFGRLPETSEADEFRWNGKNIGTKDEDHRTTYGIIIRNPDLSLSSDQLTLEIPADQVKVGVEVSGCKFVSGQNICSRSSAWVPLNSTINSVGTLDPILDTPDLAFLQDSRVYFGSRYYDIHDEIDLGIISPTMFNPAGELRFAPSPIIVTSLSSGDDDYLEGVYMEVPTRSIAYSYLFDEVLPLNTTSTSKPLTLNFMGKTLRIVKINSDRSFTIEKVTQ